MSDSSNKLVPISANMPTSLKSIFSAISRLNDKDHYVEPSCPICSSKWRFDGEKLFKSFDKYASLKREEQVKDFFDSKDEAYSMDAIRHHMASHMDRGDQELRKTEYASKIEAISSQKMSTIGLLDYAISTIMERFAAQSELFPDSKHTRTEIEDMKTSNIVQLNKAYTSVVSLRAELLGEMKKDGEAVVIPKDVFEQVFEQAFNMASTQEQRESISFILKGLGGFENK